jgi:hypothetical protein
MQPWYALAPLQFHKGTRVKPVAQSTVTYVHSVQYSFMRLLALLCFTEATYILISAETVALEEMVEASQLSVCCVQRFMLSIMDSVASCLRLLDLNLYTRKFVPFTTQ